MSFSRIYAIFLRQIFLLSNSFVRTLPLFIWGAIDVVLWGFTTKYLNQINNSTLNLVPILLGAILLWDFLVRVMHGFGVAFLEDAWSRNFLNMFASPLKLHEYIFGLILTSTTTSIIGLIVMLIIAIGVFGLSYGMSALLIATFLFILFLFGIALGIFASGLVMRYGPSAEWLMWPIPAIISPFVGVFYPLSVLPKWMQIIGHALPPSCVFENVRGIIAGKGYSLESLYLGFGLNLVYIMLAYYFLKLICRKAIRTGLIARYSAETAS